MAQAVKPGRTMADLEDAVLRRVLVVTVKPGSPEGPGLPVYLEQLCGELMSEDKPTLLSRELLERVLMDRLGTFSVGMEAPFLYLVNCYRRASEESRKAQNMRDKAQLAMVQDALQQVKDLALSYSVLMLVHPSMFPQPHEVGLGPNSLLLASLLADGSSNSGFYATSSGLEPLPPGFFEGLLKRFEDEPDGFRSTFEHLFKDLQGTVWKLSPLGPFQRCVRTLVMLVSYPKLAKVLVEHPMWNPKGNHIHGRVLEVSSILGPFFHISVIPDHPVFGNGEPNVRQQCFSDSSSRRAGDLNSSYATIKTVMHQLYDGLHEVLMKLLRNSETKEAVLQYLADVIQKNGNRSQLQSNPLAVASSGMFVSLSAVMLKLCAPFLDASLSKKDKLDARYVLQGGRLDFSGLTAILATSEELARWVDGRNHSRTEGFRQVQQLREQEELRRLQAEEASTSMQIDSLQSYPLKSMASASSDNVKFNFICECFLMTARVLNLGLIKTFSDFKSLAQEQSRRKEELATLKNMRGDGAPAQIEQDIAQLEAHIEQLSQDRLCYNSQLMNDVDLMQEALAYYRLMVVWLTGLVGGFRMPLPAVCPMEFASMPEHFVEDAMELLLFASRIPRALDGVNLDEFMSFIVMFMGSPLYIKNPYLRAKMVEVLNAWMPKNHGYSPTLSSSMASLFEGHQLALQYLVPNLLQLYVDIEFTGAHTQFYDKFNIRHNIAELLEYLWSVPSHHNSWKQIAMKEEKGSYLKFLNLLINDSIFLLDESLKKIPELKEMEVQLSEEQWSRRPAQERQERERHYHQQEHVVRYDMMLANEDVKMILYTSAEITAPFLLPEMVERIAAMLNYFLLQLVGPQRKALKVKDPEKYEFRPRELLAQIVNIYVNLDRGDPQGLFARAISSDGRSYKNELFTGAAGVLRQYGGLPMQMLDEFEALGAKARAQAQEMMDAEALLGDIPDEFLDPIQVHYYLPRPFSFFAF
ncbi:hypothetical protein KC19_10G048000 [Ceratodon purpureus]|uniref:Ubiquitin conjugation factor E4 core domain-containing protein n=1 Tax=Ceratodon purpureus TaxID=3225 RepID=A0A8T0GI85_CERPU|nr:hypothetical protein KC19_10G048000 [Ceratodon purpureus]